MAQKKELEACYKMCEDLKKRIIEVRQTAGLQILAKLSESIVSDIQNYSPELRREGNGHFGKIYALHWGTDSKHIITASQDGKLIIWNARSISKQAAITLNSAWVMTCAFSPSYNLVASGGLDNTVTIYNTASQVENETRTFKSKQVKCELEKHDGYLSCARFINDNEVLSSSGDGTCILWDIENKTPKSTYVDHTGDVMFVAVNKKAPYLFVSGSVDKTAKVWDMRGSNKHVANFIGHSSDINTVQWYPDGQAILSGSDDGSIRLFDMRSYRQLNQYIDQDNKTTHQPEALSGVTSVDTSLTGKYIFSAYDNGNVYVWNTFSSSNKPIGFMNHSNRVSSLAVSYDGYGVATGCWDFILRIFA